MKKLFTIILLLAVVILGGIGFFKMKIPKNIPVSQETFIQVMTEEGYTLEEIKEGGIKEDFPNIVESYAAWKETERKNRIKVLYCKFPSSKEAHTAFLSIYSSVKSDGTQTFEFLNESGFFGNTQYYQEFFMPTSGWISEMWCVDDTLVIAQSNEFPMLVSDIFTEKFGYKH